MDPTEITTDAQGSVNVQPDQAAIETGHRFLSALFAESDTVLFRPIETWVEAGKKQSAVDHRNTCHRRAVPLLLNIALAGLLKLAAQKRLNLFFGVCPRNGGEGRFDLAWQIRTVRALWSDIDHVGVEEALERVTKAGLPQPSIIVDSGNGVHLYWLLDTPYLIDDAGEPRPVLKEWLESKPGSKKRLRQYWEEANSKERHYLDIRANVPELSAKARHIQDVVSGIAATIGGDHTHDLARLLRIPGSMNRKDERNGRTPVPCTLVSCDEQLRYSLSLFARFVDDSPLQVQRRQVEAIPLPVPRPLTPTKRDKLSELVAACAVAPVGTRSEADWRLICAAIEKGWPQADVWAAVSRIGKFAEKNGEAYFERTWSKAEGHTREQIAQNASATSHHDPNLEEENGESDPGLVATLAQLICETNHFAQDSGGKLYRYHMGVYRSHAEAFVRQRVKALCRLLDQLIEWSSHLANEVVEFIRVDSPTLWEKPPGDVINVSNGLLKVVTRELAAHSPDHLSAIQLPVIFDPAAECPKIEKFISQVFPEDAQTLAFEIPAWLMTPDTSIQKAVLLIGPGGNGKSRYLRMVEAFLGQISVSNLSLHRLESDKFACARLNGKLANICPDLPTEHLAGTSIFKAITGGDPITGEYKFKDSFDFLPFTRLVFSANSPPRAHDASEGFFDRWLVVPFERRFRGEGDEIPADKLDAMLSEPAEQSGLLNRALDVLSRLRTDGRFSSPPSVTKAFGEFHAATDPLTVWLNRQTLEGPKLITTKRALISAFNDHCDRSGRSPMSERAFGSALKRMRPEIVDAQRTVSGKVQWCYLGIGLASNAPTDADGIAEPPSCAKPQSESLDSRDSRNSTSINLSHAPVSSSGVSISAEQDRANRVNRVKPVNGECAHEVVDECVDDCLRTSCRLCGKFFGYRPLANDQVHPSERSTADRRQSELGLFSLSESQSEYNS